MTIAQTAPYISYALDGVVAQLVERLNGIQEVRGSNPLGSTIQSMLEFRFSKVVIAIRIQTVLVVIVIINLIGLTIAAYMIMRKK